MKKIFNYVIRIGMTALFEWGVHSIAGAHDGIILTHNARIVVSPHATVTTPAVTWSDDASIQLQDSARWYVRDTIIGYDSISRFFILGAHAQLERMIFDTMKYAFPIGYAPHQNDYREFTIDMKSLGTTGPGRVSVRLVPTISGSLVYEYDFSSISSNGGDCSHLGVVSFNCLSNDGWHCDGPSDYEYTVVVYSENTCGSMMRRVIKSPTNMNTWQDSIENVVGNVPDNFCQYSDLQGTSSRVPGGTYRDFSDFTIASGTGSGLPVTLVDIRADGITRNTIRVSWTTVTEINNDKFYVGRSSDGKVFTIIGEVAGNGTTTAPHDYFFDDIHTESNITYYYQLEQVDYDGRVHWSPIVSAKIPEYFVERVKKYNLLGQEISENDSHRGFMIIHKTQGNEVRVSKTVVY